MNIVIPLSLKTLAQQFLAAGSKLYITGGYVRNAVMGGFPTDIDITANITPDRLRGVVRGAKVVPISKQLGTCVISLGSQKYDYTPFRGETYAEGGAHRPTSVRFTNSMAEDSRRRDFSCNALYYDILDNKILDPYGGVADIKSKVLKAVVSPSHVFKRDGLRILRMVRLAAETGFTIDKATFDGARELISQLKDISCERKTQELEKMLAADLKYVVQDAHYRAMKLLGDLGAWQYLLPDIAFGMNVPQNPKYHKYDVYEHTLQAVKHAPAGILRLAALMHDIGKAECVRLYGNMHKHCEIGAGIARERLAQSGLKYPNQAVNRVAKLVRYHNYDLDGMTSVSKLRLFIARHHALMDDLVALKKADALATGMAAPPVEIRMETVYRQMLAEGCPMKLADLAVNGQVILDAYPRFPKEHLGKTLIALLGEAIINPALNNEEWLLKHAGKLMAGLPPDSGM